MCRMLSLKTPHGSDHRKEMSVKIGPAERLERKKEGGMVGSRLAFWTGGKSV